MTIALSSWYFFIGRDAILTKIGSSATSTHEESQTIHITLVPKHQLEQNIKYMGQRVCWSYKFQRLGLVRPPRQSSLCNYSIGIRSWCIREDEWIKSVIGMQSLQSPIFTTFLRYKVFFKKHCKTESIHQPSIAAPTRPHWLLTRKTSPLISATISRSRLILILLLPRKIWNRRQKRKEQLPTPQSKRTRNKRKNCTNLKKKLIKKKKHEI